MAETLRVILLVIGGIACGVLLFQDMRGRWIHVLPVSVLWLSGLGYAWLRVSADLYMDLAVIAGFLIGILGVAYLVMRVRRPQERMMETQLGWGDIVFFFAMMGWFDPIGYVLYFVSGLLFVLTGVVIMLLRGRWAADRSIPLAGLLGGYAILFAPAYWYFEDLIAIWILGGY